MWRHPLTRMAGAAVSGTVITAGSATVSCVLALYVEQSAHRTLYRFFPHWYKDVDHVPLGLEQWQLDAVRGAATTQEKRTSNDESIMRIANQESALSGWNEQLDSETVFSTSVVSAQLLTIPLQTANISPTRRRPTVTPNHVFSCAMTA